MKYYDFLRKMASTRLYVIPALYKAGFKKKCVSMYECGAYKDYLICKDDYTAHFAGASSCKDRFCPICQSKRSLLYFARFVPVFKDLISKGYYINMLNFTINNTESLADGLNILTKAFRYLQHDSKVYRKLFKYSFAGGIVSKEIKQGENLHLWHPHLHAMVVKDHFSKDFEWLRDAWNHAVKVAGGKPSATDPSKYGSVFICSVTDRQGINTDKLKSIELGCLETLKYITKFDWQCTSVDKIQELINTLKGVRSISTWGILRNISTDVESDMDKPFHEIRQCCCTACGGTDFLEWTTSRTLKNVKDFSDKDVIFKQEPNYIYHTDKLTRLVELKDDLQVGQVYDGIMFTEEHEKLKGEAFKVCQDNKKIYKLRFENYTPKGLILFSRSMFK